MVSRDGKVDNFANFLFFLLIIIRSGLLAKIRWLLLLSYSFECFSQLMVFHWRPSDSKCPQVCRTLLSILVDLKNGVVWMVSTRPLISKSSCPYTNPLMTVLSTSITISITSLSCSIVFSVLLQDLGTYLPFRFLTILFCGLPGRQSLLFGRFSFLFFFHFFFLLTITRSGRLVEMTWFVCISKSQRILCVSFSTTGSRLSIYLLFVWSNLNFLHNSQMITLPTHRWFGLVWFVGFYGISTFVGYLTPNPFLCK